MKKIADHLQKILTGIIFLMLISPFALAQDRLSRIEASLADSGIEQLPYQQIAQRVQASDSDLLLFDVREPDEYAVGHLPGAIWLSPDADVNSFIEQYGDQLQQKEVVFYCSTGRRSTALAQEVKAALQKQQSPLPVPANMKGGIFRWHNAALPLENAGGSTPLIHPFNWIWRLSLERSDQTSFSPVMADGTK
ncbi:MAG: rhodanese-like domain-containing protein [Pseudomonadales bacterium]|nr:rhodanese-like domain-containing protein [Pseudomonadales bacterium]